MRFTYHPFSSVVVAGAVLLGMVPLHPLIDGPRAALTEAAFVLGASALVGLTLALLRVPRAAILFSQVIAVVGVLAWRGLRLAPAGDAVESLRALSAEGVQAIRSSTPPLPLEPGVLWLSIVVAAVLVIVVELLVNGLEQPAWSIAPLALGYGVSALIVSPDLSWWLMVPVLAGYVAILLSVTGAGEAAGQASRAGSYHLSRAIVGLAGGAIAVGLSLVIAAAVPLGDKQPWSDGGTDGPIQLSDPTVRLNEDLMRPTDAPVLTYRTSNGEPAYLRTVALPSLTSSGAGLLPMSLSRSGLEQAYPYRDLAERIEVEVQMAAVPSEYLPAPFAAAQWDAEGSWSFDPETLSIVAAGVDRIQQTVNLHYEVESTVPNPTRAQIEASGSGGGVEGVNREVPQGLDPGVARLTAEVVGEAATAGEKALLIQRFLRSDEFEYSLQSPTSGGADAISSFLLEQRSGYCIHFASAMIAMARTEGIAARMAIGFAPGQLQADGTYAVTSHDAHAWPELFLDGLGWVAFEPTPAYEGDPEYVDPSSIQQPPAPTSPAPETDPAEAATPTVAPPTTDPLQPETPADDASGGLGGASGWLLGVLGALALAASPALVRIALRRARLRSGQPPGEASDAAWREVQALFADHGLSWPDGSPGPSGAAAAAALPPEGADALRAISVTVERSRFARDGATPTELRAQVHALRSTLSRTASRPARLKALLWPASLWG